MPVSDSLINTRLEAARRELLDLSLRNPLLNYRPLKSRGVEVVNEFPPEIYRVLVKEGKAMSFLPIDSKTALNSIDTPTDGSEQAFIPTPAQTDNKLQTKETITKLQSRLLDTYHSARMFVEEQGVSILYLALGTLTWYETENSEDGRQAPLILIPVDLERTTAREQFQVRYTGGEIESNLSLIARMKKDFGISIPELPEPEELDVVAYFDEVWRQVVGRQGWVINSRMVSLGFFSFGKFMMYTDLDATHWPETSQPASHPILNALLLENGFQEPASNIPDEAHLDNFVSPMETRQVVDADSSQTLAILDVNQGRNLVIQGPPGTGKSQTITNLIAEAIGKGKLVLFVAEKMAALEVVKRRLDKVGLGEACLELHSHKANKKDLLTELKRTLDLGKPQLNGQESEINLLTQVRDRLNANTEAVNTPVGESDLTVYTIYGRLLQQREKYSGISLPRLALPSLLGWTRDQFKQREALIEEVQARLKQIGEPKKLLFYGSQRVSLLPTDQNRMAPALGNALNGTQSLKQTSAQLATAMQLPAPQNQSAAEDTSQVAQRLLQSPDYKGINLRSDNWLTQAGEIQSLLTAGAKITQLHQQYENQLIPEAWQQDVLEIRQNLLAYGDKWWNFFSGAFRKSKNQLAGLTRTGLPSENSRRLALVDAILEAQRKEKVVQQYSDSGKAAFGTQWQGHNSNWSKLAELASWATALHQDIQNQKLPAEILNYLAAEPDLTKLVPLLQNVNTSLQQHQMALTETQQLLQWNDKIRFGEEGSFQDLFFEVQETLFTQWQSRLDELHQVVAWNNLAGRLQDEGLQEIINLTLNWPEAGNYLVAAFTQTYLEALLEKAYEERPALLHFERAGHEEVIQKFNHLDNLALAYNRSRLAALHWDKLPLHQAGGQLGVLRREFEKKTRHLPIRQLITKAGQAIQAIKPVFMMGPLSIANFLPPACVTFDLVIFDEASQVKPVDAFGAIMRAKQVVVVGDSKQMPPTSFFDALLKEEETEEEENVTADVESVLGLFAAQGAPQRMLRWHYRSRHESLIAVSNQEFYEDKLVIFPSPDAERKNTGLMYHHLPNTFYDRGKTRTNPQEAEAVAKAIMAHAKEKPELTLGVAAFSMAQMQAIINQLELLRREDPSAEAYFTKHPNEPFFVKNLENVQGDERDVIYISIGYGRTEEGTITMSFGPLNGVGGERRLNVLITRARLRCEVFTNLSPDDIDLSKTQSRGVQAFKTFLSYAKNGKMALPGSAGKEVESPFEEAVLKVLTQAGYQVQTQVGSAGFFVDMAIVHPEQSGKYVLGIECDGASYHRARSARDRDRLRQSVLEGLGWQIYRVWSTDWFRNAEAEQKRLLQAVEKALEQDATKEAIKSAAPAPAPEIIRETIKPEIKSTAQLPAYVLADLNIKLGERELHELPGNILTRYVEQIVEVESPVHVQEVIRRITEAADVPRLGPRIKTALEAAIDRAELIGNIRKQKDFLWLTTMQTPLLRDRSNLPSNSRNIENIATEELELAIEKVVREAFGITAENVAPGVAKLFGFPRVNEDVREAVELVVENMLQAGVMQNQDNQIVISKK